MVIPIQSAIPFFQGNRYEIWSTKMRTLFISEDLWELVNQGYAEEEMLRDAVKGVRMRDAKALFFIQQASADSIFHLISKATTSKEAWDALQARYQNTIEVVDKDGDGNHTDNTAIDESVHDAAAEVRDGDGNNTDLKAMDMHQAAVEVAPQDGDGNHTVITAVEDDSVHEATTEVVTQDGDGNHTGITAIDHDSMHEGVAEDVETQDGDDNHTSITATDDSVHEGAIENQVVTQDGDGNRTGITTIDDSVHERAVEIVSQDGDDNHINITDMDDSVYKAAAEGDIEELKKTRASEYQVRLSPKHNTILHIACEFGQLECVEWIVKLPSCSSLLQCPNLKGDTPLHLAAREGHLELVEALLEFAKKLPGDIETGEGITNNIYKKMLMRMTNKGENTAFHEAVRFKHSDVIKLLIKEDPEYICGVDDSSRTALHAAVICNDKELIETLLESHPELANKVDENGWSPLHCAAERGSDRKIVKLLLEKSEKRVPYLGSKDGKKTALHIASFHHHSEILEEILSHSPGCREQVDDDGNNVIHFAMMKNAGDNSWLSNYLKIKWLATRGLVTEKDARGNTPLHLLSSFQNDPVRLVGKLEVDTKEYSNENSTAYNRTWGAKEEILGAKDLIENFLVSGVAGARHSLYETIRKRRERKQKSKEDREKCVSALKKRGETHLIVSALITTITFAAGFTLPGGYKDDGKAILSRKAAFKAFIATDTIAMLSSLCAVFLHFFMTMHTEEKFLEKHLLWAFFLTMIGMGGMSIAFATGIYAVLPHSSALSLIICILCSFFFLCFILEYGRNWRGTVSYMVRKACFSWIKKQILKLIFQ